MNVLFVCLGNICRFPMAEAVFRDLVKKKGLEGEISVDSAGTASYHTGEPPHRGTKKILKKYQICDAGLIARQITREDLNTFEYIIAMDSDNVRSIREAGIHGENTQILRLLDLVEDGSSRNVPDPYYTGNFNEVYELVKEGCELLLQRIMNDLSKERKEDE